MTGIPRLSVLMPAYNEAAYIGAVLEKLGQLEIEPLEIIVVDDGSTDQTAEIVSRAIVADSRIRLLRQPNCGKTAAIAAALEIARGEIIVIQDADLEYDPAEIPHLIEPIRLGHADVVYGSRFLVRNSARVLYFYHYVANRALTLLSNMLTNRNMTDIETGYKAFRACVIKPLRLTSRGFGLEAEITAQVCKTKARTYEVPISYHGRTYEEGKKIGLLDGLAAVWYILYYNLFHGWTVAGRTYVREVNERLASGAGA